MTHNTQNSKLKADAQFSIHCYDDKIKVYFKVFRKLKISSSILINLSCCCIVFIFQMRWYMRKFCKILAFNTTVIYKSFQNF